MNKAEITFNLDGLEKFRKAMESTYRARVGVLGGDAARKEGDSDLNNAEIGLTMIVGSHTKNIPARDFLLMPIERNEHEIIRDLESSSKIKAAMAEGDYKKVFELLGMIARKYVDEAFTSSGWGQWAPNSPRTIAEKGSSKPLIDTSQLRGAVSNDVVKAGESSNKGIQL